MKGHSPKSTDASSSTPSDADATAGEFEALTPDRARLLIGRLSNAGHEGRTRKSLAQYERQPEDAALRELPKVLRAHLRSMV